MNKLESESPSLRRILLAIYLAAALVLAGIWAAVIPAWENPDEEHHISNLVSMAPHEVYYSVLSMNFSNNSAIKSALEEQKFQAKNKQFQFFGNNFAFESQASDHARTTLLNLRLLNLLLFSGFIIIFSLAFSSSFGAGIESIILATLLPGVTSLIASVNTDWHGVLWSWLYLLVLNSRVFIKWIVLGLAIYFCRDRSFYLFAVSACWQSLGDFSKVDKSRPLTMAFLFLPAFFYFAVVGTGFFINERHSQVVNWCSLLLSSENCSISSNFFMPTLFDHLKSTAIVFCSLIFTAGKQAFHGIFIDYILGAILVILALLKLSRISLSGRSMPDVPLDLLRSIILMNCYFWVWSTSLVVVDPDLKAGRFLFPIAPLLINLILLAVNGRRIYRGRTMPIACILIALNCTYIMLVHLV